MTSVVTVNAGGWGTTRPAAIRYRIWDAIEKTDTCWLWTGKTTKGYGALHAGTDRRHVYAHRFVYELLVGPIPKGLELDHLCRVPACVNPDHLEPVTHKENLRRGRQAELEKTHCPQGHPYSGHNLRIGKRGNGQTFRMCRECSNASRRAARKARRGQA